MNTNLVECADCGQEISRRAAACIHCGAPNTSEAHIDSEKIPKVMTERERKDRNIIKWGTLVLIVDFVLIQMNVLHFGKHPDFNAYDVITGLISFVALVLVARVIARRFDL